MASEAKLLDGAQAHLEPGEQILAAVTGTETKIMSPDSVRSGILIATDRRVMFYAKRLTGYDLESYSYATITSIDQGKNMMGHRVTFYASVNRIDVKWIKDVDKLARFIDTARAQMHTRTTEALSTPAVDTASASPTASQPDAMELITSLARLRDAGVLSEEEFATKKAELLKRI